jgi:restriction endonuclease Mrr
MYNLLSDKLDRFEKEIRRVRNQLFGRVAGFFLRMARFVLKKSRAYLHSELLKNFKDLLQEMFGEIELELERRKKGNVDYPGFERDSTVLTAE